MAAGCKAVLVHLEEVFGAGKYPDPLTITGYFIAGSNPQKPLHFIVDVLKTGKSR